MTTMVDYSDILRARPTDSASIALWTTRVCIHCGDSWNVHFRQLVDSKKSELWGGPASHHIRCSYSKDARYFRWEGAPTVWSLVLGDPFG